MRSATRNPGLAFALNGLAVRSQQWMLTAADIDASGPRGMVRAQGLALLFASVLRTWVNDDDPGLARTMAALDRALARGQRWSGFLDDFSGFPPPPAACARAGGATRTTRTRSRSRAIADAARVLRWCRLAHAIALKTQHLDHPIAHRARKIELQRPVAMHFERNARPIGALVLNPRWPSPAAHYARPASRACRRRPSA